MSVQRPDVATRSMRNITGNSSRPIVTNLTGSSEASIASFYGEYISKLLTTIIRQDCANSNHFREPTGNKGFINDMPLTNFQSMVHFKRASNMNKLAMHGLDIRHPRHQARREITDEGLTNQRPQNITLQIMTSHVLGVFATEDARENGALVHPGGSAPRIGGCLQPRHCYIPG